MTFREQLGERYKMDEKKKILIIEDDEDISMIEEAYLSAAGYEVEVHRDGKELEKLAASGVYSLFLIDVMLPGRNGYELCKAIRSLTAVPILMVTARTEAIDKIQGLGNGADDYISKPFDPAELVARVNANLRQYDRIVESAGNEALKEMQENENDAEEIVIGDLHIFPKGYRVTKNGKEISLKTREFELLCFLAQNPNILFNKEQLYEKIWGYDYVGDAATVIVHINRIREKIEDEPKKPKLLETVWGAGYRMNK